MFKIIVTTFNSGRWIAKCLRSIQEQTIKGFQCVFVDDASTDSTYQLALEAVGSDPRFLILSNKENLKQIHSIIAGMELLALKDEDVLLWVCGDDWLKHKRVLERVQAEYNKGVWLTYGQFEYYPSGKIGHCASCPPQIIKNRSFRKYTWVTTHLKTYKYFLWKRISPKDFLDGQGRWLGSTADMAIMFPMLEMAGPRISFIADVLYVYNRENPLNRDKVALADQLRAEKLIRARPKYSLLEG